MATTAYGVNNPLAVKAWRRKLFIEALKQAELESNKANVPSFEDNPLEALKYQNEKLAKELNDIKHGQSLREQQEAQQREIYQKQNQFISTYKQKANEFKQTTPDFDNAYNFLLEGREQELRMTT